MSQNVRLATPSSPAAKAAIPARGRAAAPAPQLRAEAAAAAPLDGDAQLARAERLGHRFAPAAPDPALPPPSPAAPTAGTPVQRGKKKRNAQAHQAAGPGAGHHDILQNRRLPRALRERLAAESAAERESRAARLQAEREAREAKKQEEKKNG